MMTAMQMVMELFQYVWDGGGRVEHIYTTSGFLERVKQEEIARLEKRAEEQRREWPYVAIGTDEYLPKGNIVSIYGFPVSVLDMNYDIYLVDSEGQMWFNANGRVLKINKEALDG